ncbi:MAG: Rrf2 family transcriptional regulator [Acholeplasma sp.]|nr:Rrf2 family transcriptional regulator [Acholeplasma sp.]
MQINQNFGVAVHILVYLSLTESEYQTSSHLASSVNTNPVVVRRILKDLENAGLIETKKGRFGSRLLKKADEITFNDVYNVFYQGNILEPSHHPNEKCPVGAMVTGLISDVMKDATKDFMNTLQKYTIADIKKLILERI